MTDPIADMLTRIRNAVLVKKTEVVIPFSKIKFSIAKILEQEGFIGRAEKIKREDQPGYDIKIVLKYKDKQPVIRGIKKISRSGLRVYRGYKEMPRVIPSLGILIVSTSRGIMTNFGAKKNKIGGELICEIF